MTELTPLDHAHAAMQTAPDDENARLGFFNRLADSELLLLLTEEARGDNASPRIFETSDGTYVLAFDREERLTQFTGAPAPYLALSGRSLAGLLAGQGVGLGLNLGVAPSEYLVPGEALDWLVDTLAEAPDEVEVGIAELRPPGSLPEALLTALDAKLATAGGLAEAAYLTGFTSRDGGLGHLLGFVGAPEAAKAALAAAVNEALIFSGLEAGTVDVGFFEASDVMTARLQAVGLRFELPKPAESLRTPKQPAAPGSDPDRPPRLR